MERRNWSLEAVKEFVYIDSLDGDYKGERLKEWLNKYMPNGVYEFDLPLSQMNKLAELLYKNVAFLYKEREKAKQFIKQKNQIKQFLY
jgi:5S rRNA maturation endonuclease (ribonuclease M5)